MIRAFTRRALGPGCFRFHKCYQKRNFLSHGLEKAHTVPVRTMLVLGASTLISGLLILQKETISNDAGPIENRESSVEVDKSVSPFAAILAPPEIPLTTKYTLLGYGPRSVTFLSFKVYALGIYVANEDLPLMPKILNSTYLRKAFLDTDSTKSHSENVETALKDAIKSRVLVGSLIDGGVRFMAKITPIRNTDFNHLKDGLVKSILNHPECQKNQEAVSRGLQELKDAFTRKGSVPKNDDLIIELQANGSLQLSYRSRKQDECTLLGRVDEPLIGKFLFSQYLGGDKPLSPPTRESFVQRVKTLV
ncbi:LAQU0S22e00584g1_1 [Lachancea quebecensis]|uniref:Altered inheritance of mitochondria protein 18, mitochondrial n=1 Tax=Lachancea quebecensis TaxID=1654605 RepID=A0A0P1KXI2_9SACH|nr:LAQU0S22e00584g1_1 [Lachancea quebecensis]